MRDLFKFEVLRFRGWGLAAALVHLVVLGFLVRMVDLGQQPLLAYRAFGAVYALAGLLLGLYQMGSYRRPNAWLNLLHRPLPAWRIGVALGGAAAAWLAVAVAGPILLAALYQRELTARVMDLRHWLLPPAALMLALMGYLAGAYAMLANRRWSGCGLVFLLLVATAGASGPALLGLMAVALLWLAYLVLASFKPDLAVLPRGPLAQLATALPLQMGVYLLTLLLGLGGEMVWVVQGTHPLNMPVPPHGGHTETERMDGRQRMLAGLSASTDRQAPLWREQVALSEVTTVGHSYEPGPRRQAFANPAQPTGFADVRRRVEWVFSHDRMRFEGLRTSDMRRAGELCVGEHDASFPALPVDLGGVPGLPADDHLLAAGNRVYQYVSETGRIIPRMRLPEGEVVDDFGPIGQSLTLGTDRARYFFDGRDLLEGAGLIEPRQRVAIPGEYGNLSVFDVIEVVDGYLMSFTFSNRAFRSLGGPPHQVLLWVDDRGQAHRVAYRPMSYDYPAPFRYQAWLPSPALYAVRGWLRDLFVAPDPRLAMVPPPVPRGMWLLAGGLMLLSLLAAAWLVARRALPATARAAWILACGAIGLPALASLWLLHPEPELAPRRLRPQPA